MTALACLLGAVALVLLAPRALTVGRWQIRWPRTALTAWFLAVAAGVALVAAAGVWSVAHAIDGAGGSGPAWSVTLTLVAWLTLGGIGAVTALVGASAEPLADSHRRAAEAVAPVAISREQRETFTLVRFRAAAPIAYAIPGRSPEILVSTALEDVLTRYQLRAVLAHEYAHLRHRHGWVVRIAELNALCLPRALPAGRALRRATLLLVELIADDAAARQAGAVHLANALATMATIADDAGLQLRAERLTRRRWRPARRCRVPEPIRI